MKVWILFAAALALGACDIPDPEREAWEANQAAAPASNEAAPVPAEPEPEPGPLEPDPPGTRWETSATGEGASLILLTPAGERHLTLFCRPRSGLVVVNVPRFRPAPGGETMSVSAGGSTIFLDSLASADLHRGGVSGTMAMAGPLSAVLRGRDPISVGYGTQTSGPHDPMQSEIASNFIATCHPAPSAGA